MDPIDEEEAVEVAQALVVRVTEGSIPPDDAYWWTRIVCRSFEPLIEVKDAA